MGLRMEGQPVVFDKFAKINTMIFDVDGVWTDGSLLVSEKGDLLRTMNTRDGYAGRRAVLAGYKVYIITGGNSLGVKDRLEKLGVSGVFLNARNKIDIFNDLVAKGEVDPSRSLYVGDDLPDCEVLKAVYLSCCPSDAASELLAECEYISPYEGGRGCVRDIIEKVMRSQEKW